MTEEKLSLKQEIILYTRSREGWDTAPLVLEAVIGMLCGKIDELEKRIAVIENHYSMPCYTIQSIDDIEENK